MPTYETAFCRYDLCDGMGDIEGEKCLCKEEDEADALADSYVHEPNQ